MSGAGEHDKKPLTDEQAQFGLPRAVEDRVQFPLDPQNTTTFDHTEDDTAFLDRLAAAPTTEKAEPLAPLALTEEKAETLPPAKKPKKDTPHYAGHRERLRGRFIDHGAKALADYELLELMLFRSIPRADTKPIAKALIARFGSFAEVVAADPRLLQEVKGVGQAVATDIALFGAASDRLLFGRLKSQVILSSWKQVLDYCRSAMAFAGKEQLRILFLDKRNKLIADEVQQIGTIDHTPVYPREVLKRAIELSSSAIILVHNHPSGDPAPSPADIEMTLKIKTLVEELNITLHDHLIIGRKGHVSLRAEKYI